MPGFFDDTAGMSWSSPEIDISGLRRMYMLLDKEREKAETDLAKLRADNIQLLNKAEADHLRINGRKKEALLKAQLTLEKDIIGEAETARIDSDRRVFDLKKELIIEQKNFESDIQKETEVQLIQLESNLLHRRKQNRVNEATFSATLRASAAQAELDEENKRHQEYLKFAQAEYTKKVELKKKELEQNYALSEAQRAAELEAFKDQLDEQYKLEGAAYEKWVAKRERAERREKTQQNKADVKAAFDTFGKNSTASWDDRKDAFKKLYQNDAGEFDFNKLGSSIVNGLAQLAKQLENKMDEVGKHKAPIDTRLYGSTANSQSMGSYWEALSGDFMAIAGASPLLLQSKLVESLEKLVGSGISYNIKLRSFLDATADKIAATFEVADSTLLKIVRVQQQDSTAARMGMESALNAFLNNMYETTEYLTNLADSVRSNIYEAQALMDAKDAVEFEYQVQKWMGSLYSVGMSDSAVQAIATALGQFAAGDIEGLTSNGAGNLLIMAANSAGISIADVLHEGLDTKETNTLLKSIVEYLASIAKQTDSKVIQQQLANIFGLKASDLKSVMNLVSDNKTLQTVYNNSLSYMSSIGELTKRAASMTMRTSIGDMMTNVWENIQYSMAAGMANNPVTYFLYKAATLLEQTTGGIDLPFMNVYGFGLDLNTTVAQLMQAGAMAGGILGSIGNLVTALGNLAGGGAAMLATAGLANASGIITRGTGAGLTGAGASGISTSESGLVGNASGGDVQGATMAQAADTEASTEAQAKEDNEDATRDDIIEVLKALFGGVGEKLDDITEAVYATSDKPGVGTWTPPGSTGSTRVPGQSI